jgi:hypothetical protein
MDCLISFTDANGFVPVLGHGLHPKDTEHMKALTLAADTDSGDDDGMPCCRQRRVRPPKAAPTISTDKLFGTLDVKITSDTDDDDFVTGSESSSSSSDENSDIQEITNIEVIFHFT